MRVAFVDGVSAAKSKAEGWRDVVGRFAEHRPSPGVDVSEREGGNAGESNVESVECVGLEIINAAHEMQPVAVIEHLEFLAELVVAVDCRHIHCRRGGG